MSRRVRTPALDTFILIYKIMLHLSYKLDIDCRPKFSLLFKTMLKGKFPSKHISGILCGALLWPPTKSGLCLHLDETNGSSRAPN